MSKDLRSTILRFGDFKILIVKCFPSIKYSFQAQQRVVDLSFFLILRWGWFVNSSQHLVSPYKPWWQWWKWWFWRKRLKVVWGKSIQIKDEKCLWMMTWKVCPEKKNPWKDLWQKEACLYNGGSYWRLLCNELSEQDDGLTIQLWDNINLCPQLKIFFKLS